MLGLNGGKNHSAKALQSKVSRLRGLVELLETELARELKASGLEIDLNLAL